MLFYVKSHNSLSEFEQQVDIVSFFVSELRIHRFKNIVFFAERGL